MQEHETRQTLRRQWGQSLAEVAISMPILLLLIAGLVEVSQMVITQNRISTAARNAARFGAQGGEDAGIRNITLNTVTQTLDLSDGVWDVFVVRAELDRDGNLPESNFRSEHVYGAGLTQAFTSTTSSAAWEALREEIVDSLSYPGTDPSGLKVVGVLILHDLESILGLDIIPTLIGRNTIRGFSIMRNSALATTVSQSTGCNGAYPLAVEWNVRSILREDFEELVFTSPSPPPSYNSFSGHVENRELPAGREGYLFKLNIASGASDLQRQIVLLDWNGTGTAPGTPADRLERSMRYPGNSNDTTYGYVEPGDTSDRELQVGDIVLRANGAPGSLMSRIADELDDHIDTGRALRVMLWNALTDETAAPGTSQIQITGFAIFRIRGYGNEGGALGPWMLLELVRIDNSCGQPS